MPSLTVSETIQRYRKGTHGAHLAYGVIQKHAEAVQEYGERLAYAVESKQIL